MGVEVHPDYRYGKYISNPYEVETLQAFLNTSYGGVLNGKILSSSYDPYDKETWGDGVKSHFIIDGSRL